MIDSKISSYETNNDLFELIEYVSMICLIIFYIFEKNILWKISNKQKKENVEKNIRPTVKIMNKNKKKIKIYIKHYIKITFLFTFSLIFTFIFIYNVELNESISILEYHNLLILLLMIIQSLFFNKYFYSHQFLSIIIIIFIFFTLLIQKYIQSQLKYSFILLILGVYSYSFSFHLIKYINTEYYINIYLLGCFNGIFLLIQYLIQKEPIFFKFDFFDIFINILYFIIQLIHNFLFYTIINKFGPIHSWMSYFISMFLLEIIFYNNFYDYLSIGFGILLIISCLIYLEILELNFFNLNKNIRKKIKIRAEEEMIKEFSNSIGTPINSPFNVINEDF